MTHNHQVAYKIYEKGGQYAVYDAVRNGIVECDEWVWCKPCEDRTPHHEDTCLVCGSES
jgi:hypothetical protein